MASYFAAVLGIEYFDGPMAGVGVLPDKSTHYFRIVGWDDDHEERVFVTAEIPARVTEELWTAFEAVEPSRRPEWYPLNRGAGEVRTRVDEALTTVHTGSQRAGYSKALQSRDLVGNTTEVRLDNSQSRAIQRMIADERILELGTEPILEKFLRDLRIGSKLTIDPSLPAKLYSAGGCPVCADSGALLCLAALGSARLVLFCPLCGVAWQEPPAEYRVDEILTLDILAPAGVTLPTELQVRASPYPLNEVPFEVWFPLLNDELGGNG